MLRGRGTKSEDKPTQAVTLWQIYTDPIAQKLRFFCSVPEYDSDSTLLERLPVRTRM